MFLSIVCCHVVEQAFCECTHDREIFARCICNRFFVYFASLPPDQNCLDQNGQQKGKSVQKLSINIAKTCYRISKTTEQSYIKQSRGLKAYCPSRKYPKMAEKSS